MFLQRPTPSNFDADADGMLVRFNTGATTLEGMDRNSKTLGRQMGMPVQANEIISEINNEFVPIALAA